MLDTDRLINDVRQLREEYQQLVDERRQMLSLTREILVRARAMSRRNIEIPLCRRPDDCVIEWALQHRGDGERLAATRRAVIGIK